MSNERKLADLPDDWWQRLPACEDLAEWFGRHLVALFLSAQVRGAARRGIYTGLVLHYQENLLWVTAGHVVDQIRRVLSDPDITVHVMRWLDGCEIPGAESIPIHNRELEMFSGLEYDVDFGCIRVTGLDAANMLSNNRTQVLTEEIWLNLEHARPEGFYVLGYPQVWTPYQEAKLPDNQLLNPTRANLACLPVRQIEYRANAHTTKAFWNDPEAFYGQILPFVEGSKYQPASLQGMSGGPLFSLERDPSDRIRYRLFGIQRSEDRDERLIRVEPIHRCLGLAVP